MKWKTIVLILIFSLNSCLIQKIAGAFQGEPEDLEKNISIGAKKLIENAFEGIDSSRLTDFHTHINGINTGKTGCFVNKKMRSFWHIKEYLRFKVYLSALGVKDDENADRKAVERLVRLIRNIKGHGKYQILAFDKHYRKDGSVDMDNTEFYCPNFYAYKLAEEFPDVFIPAISVHPYRKDALDELEKWGKKGVRLVKWLPNAQGINPSDPDIEPFYEMMKKYKMILLTHAGEEKAVDADDAQKLGNPLLLRKPLDMGVKVIVAHCASLGQNEDLDDPLKTKRDNFDLFLRLMDEKKYVGLLFGETSAQVQFNRLSKPIATMMLRKDLLHRLVNGSDYPLPAVNLIIRTSKLVEKGFITLEERKYLNEIYNYNPLLFDFVVKRTIKHPETKEKLPAEMFHYNKGLDY